MYVRLGTTQHTRRVLEFRILGWQCVAFIDDIAYENATTHHCTSFNSDKNWFVEMN